MRETLALAQSGTGALTAVLAGLIRFAGYLGLVLTIGITTFLTWLWPGHGARVIFARLFHTGALVTVVTLVAGPLLADSAPSAQGLGNRVGLCAAGRIVLICAGVALSPTLLGAARARWALVVGWQLAVIETYVLGSDAWVEPWRAVKIVATTAHLAATAAWLGGLLTLAAILLPVAHLDVLHAVLPRFSVVAVVSVVTLTVTGAVHALAVAGSVQALMRTSYGTVLVVKVIVFAVMLLLGNVGRQYAASLAHRKVTELDESASEQSVRALAVAIGAEVALATAVLGATAALVQVVP